MATMIPKLTPARRYPWEKWANGRTWRLTKGDDFHGDPETLRSTIYTYARRHGLTATVAVKGNAVEVQFKKPTKRKGGAK